MDEEIKNAIIESATLEICDRGFLTANLTLDYGVTGQCFGGYALYLPESFFNHKLDSGVAGHFIFRVMKIAGVDKWDQLVGKTIRAKASYSKVHAIGHIIKDDWFNPSEDFKSE